MITVYTDGSQKEICYIIERENHEETIIVPFAKSTTGNRAEYCAIIQALIAVLKLPPCEVQILSDSELAVKQILGQYATRSPELIKLWREVWALREQARERGYQIDFRHIPREINSAGKVLEERSKRK